MNQSTSKDEPASKTYNREYLTAMITYAVMLIVSALLIKHVSSAPGWSILLALVPLIPLLFALRAFLRFFQRIDELQKRIQLEALALSFGITCVVTWSYGLLEYAGFPSLSWIWVPAIMLILWDIGVYVASRRYR